MNSSPLKRSKSFLERNGIEVTNQSNEALRRDFGKSVEYGLTLFTENQKLRKELEIYKLNYRLTENIRTEIENIKHLHGMEKENLEAEIYELRKKLNVNRNETEFLTKENEKNKRDLDLTRSNLTRVIKNNKTLRKEKVTSSNEFLQSRRFSMHIESNPHPMIESMKKSRSCGSLKKEESITSEIERKSESMDRIERKRERHIKIQKRRVTKSLDVVKDSMTSIKKELYATNLWFSQMKFEGTRKLKFIGQKSEVGKESKIMILESKVKELEKIVSEKDMKHASQIEQFLILFEINNIYAKNS